jgi:WD40 repeat protein
LPQKRVSLEICLRTKFLSGFVDYQKYSLRGARRYRGHTGSVCAVAFSPDGQLLASASNDTTVRLWNPATGKELQKLEGHTDWVRAVVFSPDSQLLVSASYDTTVRIWNPVTGKEIQKVEGHTHSVRAVAFSSDGQLLASVSGDTTVKLWNPVTEKELQKLEGHTGWVQAVVFSPDGQLLAFTEGRDIREKSLGVYVGLYLARFSAFSKTGSLYKYIQSRTRVSWAILRCASRERVRHQN